MTALLRFDSVAKSYARGPRELRVLHDVDLAVEPGQFVGVYGTRGAGKTTLPGSPPASSSPTSAWSPSPAPRRT